MNVAMELFSSFSHELNKQVNTNDSDVVHVRRRANIKHAAFARCSPSLEWLYQPVPWSLVIASRSVAALRTCSSKSPIFPHRTLSSHPSTARHPSQDLQHEGHARIPPCSCISILRSRESIGRQQGFWHQSSSLRSVLPAHL